MVIMAGESIGELQNHGVEAGENVSGEVFGRAWKITMDQISASKIIEELLEDWCWECD